jgi:hypothetical protein
MTGERVKGRSSIPAMSWGKGSTQDGHRRTPAGDGPCGSDTGEAGRKSLRLVKRLRIGGFPQPRIRNRTTARRAWPSLPPNLWVQNSRGGVSPGERTGRSQGGSYSIRKGGTPMSIVTILIIIILVLVVLYLLRRVF